MLRRIFKSEKVFSWLFIISFVAVFLIMYFGLYLYKQIEITQEGKDNSTYGIYWTFNFVMINDEKAHYIDYSSIKIGNVFDRLTLTVGNESGGSKGVDFLAVQNEELIETISGGEKIPMNYSLDVPLCVIGDQWEKKTFIKNGDRYIRLLNTDVRVIGIFDRITLKGTDNRILILGDSVDENTKAEWYQYTGQCVASIKYKSNIADNKDKIMELLEESVGEGNVDVSDFYDDISTVQRAAKTFIPMMKIFLAAASILCLITMFFLTSVWSRTHTFEFMIKRALGYKTGMFIPEILKTLLLYEIPAFVLTMIITFVYELVENDANTWLENISGGLYIVVMVFIAVVFLVTLVPLKWISKAHPADYVCSRE